MRLALVLGTSAGGVGRHVRMLAEGMAGRGADVVVAGPASTEERFGFTAGGARFAEVEISDRPRPAADARAVLRLRTVLRHAHAVHAHGLRAGALAGLALIGVRGPALVVTLHNASTAGGAVGAVYRVLERIVAARAARVLVVSPDLGERMRACGARVVEAAIVPAPPLGAASRKPAEVRAELGPADRPLLLVVARLAQQKGLDVLLDAAARIRGASIVVAGGGPLEGTLRRRAEAEGLPVRFLGERHDMADLLAAADGLVVPSLWEGQPLSVQEALRAGVPVVATRVGGVPDLVGDAALLVPPGDPAALAEAVGRFAADPALRDRLAAAAARRGAALPGRPEALDAAGRAYGFADVGG
ncbi:glycosyltransferase [Rhizohabitans arisaemae]|uniref:glycosyltransferase n=1 Tax=Rhizohabitans arisaemae TaxID=2720610 RepID=UPI0024B1CB36|nr:glycosyltransferase [Rhizohabitans arisaemae]